MNQYRIGEFSRITGITIKALRHYQEEGLLVPQWVDEENGYRYYSDGSAEKARLIRTLKDLGFSLQEIRPLVGSVMEDSDLQNSLEQKLQQVQARIASDRGLERRLKDILSGTASSVVTSPSSLEESDSVREISVREILLRDVDVLSFRFRGLYSEIGKVIARLSRAAGRNAAGPPFSLYYDGDHREEDADIEVCIPLVKPVIAADSVTRLVQGGPALTIVYQGPYEGIGRGYQLLLNAFRSRQLEASLPLREEYKKGPGILLRGNPANYRTQLSAFLPK